MTQISNKTTEGFYETTFSFDKKEINYINEITKKLISSNQKLKLKDDEETYNHYFKVLVICFAFYNFLIEMFNNYNGINLIGFNKQNFEYEQNAENIIFKINHPYLHRFKTIKFNFNPMKLLVQSIHHSINSLDHKSDEIDEKK